MRLIHYNCFFQNQNSIIKTAFLSSSYAPILSSNSDSRNLLEVKLYTGFSVLIIFFIFLFQRIKIEKIAENDVKLN